MTNNWVKGKNGHNGWGKMSEVKVNIFDNSTIRSVLITKACTKRGLYLRCLEKQ